MVLLQWCQHYAMGEKIDALETPLHQVQLSEELGIAHALRNRFQPDYVAVDLLVAQVHFCLAHINLPSLPRTPCGVCHTETRVL